LHKPQSFGGIGLVIGPILLHGSGAEVPKTHHENVDDTNDKSSITTTQPQDEQKLEKLDGLKKWNEEEKGDSDDRLFIEVNTWWWKESVDEISPWGIEEKGYVVIAKMLDTPEEKTGIWRLVKRSTSSSTQHPGGRRKDGWFAGNGHRTRRRAGRLRKMNKENS
jgi:hypothetical protein